MCYSLLRLLQVVFVFFICVNANPIIIRSGAVKNQGQKENLERYGTVHNKGIANFEADDGFNKEKEQKHLNTANNGRYGESGANKRDHVNQNEYNKGIFYQGGGGDLSDQEIKTGHKKGHHKTGFHNSYHKDEHGSNSSFYDDALDEGGNYHRKSQKGIYGDSEQGSRRNGDFNAAHSDDEVARQGSYDNGNRYDKDRANRQKYNRNIYYDDKEIADRRRLANDYGAGNRYAEDYYTERPYYDPPYQEYSPYNRPINPRKHITIYEDPRYVRGAPYKQYDDDYVELEVKPRLDYQHHRRPYDYY